MQVTSRYRLHLLQVDPEDEAFGLARLFTERVDALDGHLAPPARCGAKIDDTRAGYQKMESVIQFHDLVGRASAIPFGLGAFDIGIVELPLQPARRTELAAPGGLHLDLQVTLPSS